jgi:hypothetical protein
MVIDWLICKPVLASRPEAQIDHLTSLGAERPMTICRTIIDGLLANRATHFSMYGRKCQMAFG